MAKITLTIPDDKIDRIINAIASEHNMYSDQVANPDFDPSKAEDPTTNPKTIPNPVGKAEFAKDFIIKMIKREVINAEHSSFNQQLKSIGDQVNAIDIQ